MLLSLVSSPPFSKRERINWPSGPYRIPPLCALCVGSVLADTHTHKGGPYTNAGEGAFKAVHLVTPAQHYILYNGSCLRKLMRHLLLKLVLIHLSVNHEDVLPDLAWFLSLWHWTKKHLLTTVSCLGWVLLAFIPTSNDSSSQRFIISSLNFEWLHKVFVCVLFVLQCKEPQSVDSLPQTHKRGVNIQSWKTWKTLAECVYVKVSIISHCVGKMHKRRKRGRRCESLEVFFFLGHSSSWF